MLGLPPGLSQGGAVDFPRGLACQAATARFRETNPNPAGLKKYPGCQRVEHTYSKQQRKVTDFVSNEKAFGDALHRFGGDRK